MKYPETIELCRLSKPTKYQYLYTESKIKCLNYNPDYDICIMDNKPCKTVKYKKVKE